jgi:hypothetical protein
MENSTWTFDIDGNKTEAEKLKIGLMNIKLIVRTEKMILTSKLNMFWKQKET